MAAKVTFGEKDARRLREEEIAWLTTVGPDGLPRPVPIWFLWDGESFLIYSKPDKPKLRNIAHNAKVALNLNSNPTGEDVLIIYGTARVDPAAPAATEVPAYLEKYRRGIAEIFKTPAEFAAEYSVALRLTPTRAQSPY